MLLDLHRKKFGDFLPLIRRQDVKGFVDAPPDLAQPAARRSTQRANSPKRWNTRPRASIAARRRRAHDDAVRDLLRKLAAAEDKHEALAHELGENISPQARATAKTRPRGACSCCNMCSRASPG